MHPTVIDIGRALRAARQAGGVSQRVLSDRSGLTQAHISRFEAGLVNPRLSSLVELARGIGLEVMLVPRKAVPAAVEMGAEPGGTGGGAGGTGGGAGGDTGGGAGHGGADNG